MSPLVCASILALGLALTPAPAEQTTGQQVIEGTLRDHDYAFELARPRPDWRVLAEPAIRRAVPDAVAGVLSHGSRIWGAVIVERFPGATVDAYADFLLENLPVERLDVVEKESLEFEGRDAVRWVVEGDLQGMRIRYADLIVARGEWFYQLVTWALPEHVPDVADLFLAHDGFSLTEGEVKGRQAAEAPPDGHGPGWQLNDGTFRSAVYRLEVRPPEGWRLAVGDELREMNPEAEIGLLANSPGVYIIVIPEVALVEDREGFVDFVRSVFEANVGSELIGSREFLVNGRRRTFNLYSGPESIALEYLHGVWFEEEICYQILAWYAASLGETAREALPAGLAAVRLLDEAEADRLLVELKTLPDPTDAVGADFSLRGGVYRDFASRIQWRVPDRGVWDVVTGQTARVQHDEAALAFAEKTNGLFGVLILEEAGDVKPRKYHAAVIDSAKEIFGAAKRPRSRTTRLGSDRRGFLTTFVSSDEPAIGYNIATFVDRGVGARLRIFGAVSSLAKAGSLVDEAIRGFGRLPAEQAPTVLAEGTYLDWRMGFGMKIPEGFEGPHEIALGSMSNMASAVGFSLGSEHISALAINPGVDRLDDRVLMDVAQPVIIERLGQGGLRPVERGEGSLAGLPAVQRSFVGGKGRAKIFLARRGRTVYGLTVIAADEERIERLKQALFLLD